VSTEKRSDSELSIEENTAEKKRGKIFNDRSQKRKAGKRSASRRGKIGFGE